MSLVTPVRSKVEAQMSLDGIFHAELQGQFITHLPLHVVVLQVIQ